MRLFLLKTWAFTWWEMGILKAGLISLGLILGYYFSQYLDGLIWLWVAIFALMMLYCIVKMIREE